MTKFDRWMFWLAGPCALFLLWIGWHDHAQGDHIGGWIDWGLAAALVVLAIRHWRLMRRQRQQEAELAKEISQPPVDDKLYRS